MQTFGADPPRRGEPGRSGGRSGLGGKRRLIDVMRGRTPVQYSLELIPFFAAELPPGLGRLSFVWERGSKVLATEAATVNAHTHACFWGEQLRQVATFYQDSGVFAPKEYVLKVQTVTRNGSHEERHTVAKTRIDLARYCNTETEPLPQEVFLDLKPAGRLKLSIKAGWLKDAPPLDPDTLTEVSFTTLRSGTEGGAGVSLSAVGGDGSGFDEQDLSGFEAGGGGSAAEAGHGPSSGHQHSALHGPVSGGPQRTPPRGSLLSQEEAGRRATAAHAQQPTSSGGGPKAAGVLPAIAAGGGGSPRIAAFVNSSAPQQQAAPVSMRGEGNQEDLERQKARVREAAQQHIQAMQRHSDEHVDNTEEAMAGAAGGPPLGCWVRLRALLCCCWPWRRTAPPTAAAEPGTVPPTAVADTGDGPVQWAPTSAEL